MPRYHFAVKDAARYDEPDGTEVPDDAAATGATAANPLGELH
jgi:hypothetical protein